MLNTQSRFRRASVGFGVFLGAFLALGLVSTTASGELQAQTAPNPPPAGSCEDLYDVSPVVVPLDGTGISDWRFLNPRKPYPLVRLRREDRRAGKEGVTESEFDRCRGDVDLVFSNQTPDRAFNVTLEVEVRSPPVAEAGRALADLHLKWAVLQTGDEDSVDELLLALSAPGAKFGAADEAHQTLRSQLEAEQGALTARRKTVRAALVLFEAAADAASKEALEKAVGRKSSLENELGELEDRLGEIAAQLQSLGEYRKGQEKSKLRDRLYSETLSALPLERREQFLLSLSLAEDADGRRRALSRLAFPTVREFSLRGDLSTAGARLAVCDDSLDRLSTAPSRERLERFRSACLGGPGSLAGEIEKVLEENASREGGKLLKEIWDGVEKHLRDVAAYYRTFHEDETGEFALTKGCKLDGTKATCTVVLNILASETAEVPPALVAGLDQGLVTFKVAFSDGADTPVNKTGYLQTKAGNVVDESKKTNWTLKGAVTYDREPIVPGKNDDGDQIPITPDAPYSGDEKRRSKGSASLTLDQKLGTRAEASVTFQFKNGDLGGKDSNGDTTVPKYLIEFYGDNGVITRFGKSTFTSGIGSNEKGEGYEYFWRGFSLAHLIKRESAEGTADAADLDHEVFIFQGRNLSPGANVPGWMRFDVLAVYGEDDKPVTASSYWTAGAKFYFGVPQLSLHGDFAVAHSQREPEGEESTVLEGKGTSAVLSMTWSQLATKTSVVKKGTPEWSLIGTLGYGDGDDPETAEIDEGYLGETASYSAGSLFLPHFAGKIGEGESVLVPGGLSNKLYFGATFTTKTASLLEVISRLFRTQEPVTSRSTSVSFHHFRFNEPFRGDRGAANEVEVKFDLQLPKGVTTQLGAAWLFVDDGLDDILLEEAWSVELGFSVTL